MSIRTQNNVGELLVHWSNKDRNERHMKEFYILKTPIQDYGWGSHTAIPELLGTPERSGHSVRWSLGRVENRRPHAYQVIFAAGAALAIPQDQ